MGDTPPPAEAFYPRQHTSEFHFVDDLRLREPMKLPRSYQSTSGRVAVINAAKRRGMKVGTAADVDGEFWIMRLE